MRQGREVLPILLLLALPASGKTEICRYLDQLDDETRATDMGLGSLVLLDDYPYVLVMRRVSRELNRLGLDPVFFSSGEESMPEPRIWSALIQLLNEDYLGLQAGQLPGRGARHLLTRIEAAAAAAGIPPVLSGLQPEVVAAVTHALDPEARFAQARSPVLPSGHTTVAIEFARGGPPDADFETLPPRGYRHSLSLLRPEILERAAILYVHVTPDESRRRNLERARPGGDTSALHHHVPDQILQQEYGCDDFVWLLDQAEQPGTVAVKTAERTFHVPAARFDNRVDHTSFLRTEPETWPPGAVAELHTALSRALGSLKR
jgi:hypothetical protein